MFSLQISNVVERQLANMFPCMEYIVRLGWLPDGSRLVSVCHVTVLCSEPTLDILVQSCIMNNNSNTERVC